MTKWLPIDADDETAQRIKDEWEQIATALGDAAPEPDAERCVAINVEGRIQFTTATAMYALASTGVAVAYRPLVGGAEDATFWRDGHKIRHHFNPPPNESN